MTQQSVGGTRDPSEAVKDVILSVSSDIGMAIARKWLGEGRQVVGTFRSETPELDELRSLGLETIRLDLADEDAVLSTGEGLSRTPWNRLILAGGSQDPIGLFPDVDLRSWGRSVAINFTRQFQFLGMMLPGRSNKDGAPPRVLAFAGGGTNGAPTHYSAYIVSKIASIKMIELLAAEVPDTGFVILGPGWVRTKIHEATLKAGAAAGHNLETTRRRFRENHFYPLEDVVAAITWVFESPMELTSGRNFSAVHDPWGDERLLSQLERDAELFKLRRFGNMRFEATVD